MRAIPVIRAVTADLISDLISSILPPPPELTVSQWADEYRRLSKESSAEPGRWVTDRAPYQKGIMDVVTNPKYSEIVIMASAQVGKSELLLNTVGYHIDYDPASILLVQPTEDKAKEFSKERLAPMIRDTPTLQRKVSDPKTRDSGNTVLNKSFPGGYIALGGANAPAGLASRPIRILLMDEVDRFPVSAGSEGDPVSLAEKRTNNFHNKKIIKVSTPTTKGLSRIEREFEKSTKDYYHLPCPSCGYKQPLSWSQIHFETATHACKECGAMHKQFEWQRQRGEWRATAPDARIKGFHLNELLSPWRKWEDIIQDFKEAKDDPELLKVWVNTSLGETWEEKATNEVKDEHLLKRLERYDAEVPDEVKILTAAVDTQDDRFEIEVVGWGAGRESWGIEYHRIYGDLTQPLIWAQLDEYLSRTWSKADGKRYAIAQAVIDSGGHFTQEVYRFTKEREGRRIFAIKGKSTRKGEYDPLIAGVTRPRPLKALLVHLGVSEGKRKVMNNLQIEQVGPNYCHFPSDRNYNEEYFKMLTAEQLVTRYEKGVPYQVWVKRRERNEALDLRVYNLAALEILNPDLESPTSDYQMLGVIQQGQKGARKRRKRRTVKRR